MKFSSAICLLAALAPEATLGNNVRRRDEIEIKERSSAIGKGLTVKVRDESDSDEDEDDNSGSGGGLITRTGETIALNPTRSINRNSHNPHIQPRGTGPANTNHDYEVPDSSDYQTRIVGGSQVKDEDEYPWFVFWDVGCGGSLILPDVVLTAAHCNSKNKDVTVGSYYLDDRNTDVAVRTKWNQKLKHPNYSGSTLENDFLLLRLEEPVSNTPVQINDSNGEPDDGDSLTVIGHGSTRSGGGLSNELMEAEVDAIENCGNYGNNEIDDDVMFCAGIKNVGGIDSCQGDSGGPIFSGSGSNAVQLGVVSWGYGCAEAGYPGVYARISGQYDWIKENACDMSNVGGALCGDSPNPDPTPAPVTAPVPAPTPSPPTDDNDGDAKQLVVTLSTDRFPGDNYWFILDADTFETLEYIDGFTKKTDYVVTHNVPKDGCVYFDFYDAFCDGLKKNGNLLVEFDGDELYDGRKVGCGIEGFIGDGC